MWETIDSNTERLRVPGGWIVRSHIRYAGAGCAVHQVFVADSQHAWVLQPVEAGSV